jgi:hypothetical protein
MSYECSDECTRTQNICNSSTHSHASEGEDCSKNCKCKWALTPDDLPIKGGVLPLNELI